MTGANVHLQNHSDPVDTRVSARALRAEERLLKSTHASVALKKYLAHPIFTVAVVIWLFSMLQKTGLAPWLTESALESYSLVFCGLVLFFFGLGYVLAQNATWKNVLWHMIQLGGGLGFIYMALSMLRSYEPWKVAGLFSSIVIFAGVGALIGFFWSIFLYFKHPTNP